MTDTRTLSSSSSSAANPVNGTTNASPLPSDLQNVTGLTNYVSNERIVAFVHTSIIFILGQYHFSTNGREILNC